MKGRVRIGSGSRLVVLAIAGGGVIMACDSKHPNKPPEMAPISQDSASSQPAAGSGGTTAATTTSTPIPTGPVDLKRVAHTGMCVTHGAIEKGATAGHIQINHPKMRCVVSAPTSPFAEVRFTYLGPTDHDEPLASGQIRRQIGLKLRAANGCNLVYAMWRIEPESKLVVSVKHNPGMRTNAECGTKGYTNIKPRRSSPVPLLTPGSQHSLRAQMDGDEMKVTVDGAVVWEGALGPEALESDGPVGLRTDNGRFDVEYFAGMAGDAPISASGCGAGGAEE